MLREAAIMTDEAAARHFRTLFISDIHLGAKSAQAEMLIDFLRFHDAEKIYLVGDIVDGWRLKRSWNWPQSHNDVVQKLLRKARKGATVIYIPGNHDEFLRDFTGRHFGGVEVKLSDVHVTADGRRFLVMHGDEFDVVVRNARIIAYLGDWAYDAAIAINLVFNKIRRRLGFPYWSFSSWAKLKVKNAVNFIGAFEEALAEEARRMGCDGVICGHIHHAQLADHADVGYINTGDWVESCTAVAERHDGSFELIRWSEVVRARAHAKAAQPRIVSEQRPVVRPTEAA
ncbi:UDP-2,3-diacylglucosamine diphosphatase [Jiella avicenniae]|uniref:UDP-2,3-diacylglucosamine diphosphatase n=1 Tax=Jiella avicenniae TaxID=2907202 RepID=A0A9X1T487_9HYPH|nr:UDP-2,3-diacylglucosamine diphosphatase [Jiella avicenniae]MCE7027384.1 UDP-2,3-diacylglucosamine diphosphatase [Jiella avicenniae]